MGLKDYLTIGNGGNQVWQMMKSNLTSGTHPYNFTGICRALVVQWLLELAFPEGAFDGPEELARYLLNGDLGNQGYGGITGSQGIYGGNETNAQMVTRHSGGALTEQNLVTAYNANDHFNNLRQRIYGSAPNIIRLGETSGNWNGIIGITGNNHWLLAPFFGSDWSHAIGVHSTLTHVYIFDPNYGIFVFPQDKQGIISNFITDLWADYKVSEGRVTDIV